MTNDAARMRKQLIRQYQMEGWFWNHQAETIMWGTGWVCPCTRASTS